MTDGQGAALQWPMTGTHASPIERLMRRSVRNPETGCLEWQGGVAGKGYASLGGEPGKRVLGHRLVWEHEHGPIPPGLMVLHTCDNMRCVAVEHLFLGTGSDNMRDAASKGRIRNRNTGKTHCSQGHAYDEANTRIYRGQRWCRACSRERNRRRRAG